MKKLILGIVLSILLVLGVFVSTANASKDTDIPKGNNGTIKISDSANPDGIPDNNPHVICGFNVEFYNYDAGSNSAIVDFALHSPTAGSGYTLAVTGNTRPVFNGGKGLNASEHYTLGFTGQAQAQQGYHVKLTVEVPGSKGADKKHKVFWIQPCSSTTSNSETPQVLGASTPTSLPNTGAGSIIALFTGVTTLAGLGHYVVSGRR